MLNEACNTSKIVTLRLKYQFQGCFKLNNFCHDNGIKSIILSFDNLGKHTFHTIKLYSLDKSCFTM